MYWLKQYLLPSGIAGSRQSWRICPIASLGSAFLYVGPSLQQPLPAPGWHPYNSKSREKEDFFSPRKIPVMPTKIPEVTLTGKFELHTHPWTNYWEEGDGKALISLEPVEGWGPSNEVGWLCERTGHLKSRWRDVSASPHSSFCCVVWDLECRTQALMVSCYITGDSKDPSVLS